MTSRFTCRICGNAEGNTSCIAREMMFGFRDEFSYIECVGCGCLQLAEHPENLAKYYPDDYYSYSEVPRNKNPFKRFLSRKRDYYLFTKKGIPGRLAALKYPNAYLDWARNVALNDTSRVLDIGCGSGFFLQLFKNAGLHNVLGADPFIKADLKYGNGLRVLKKPIDELDGQWDLITLHHAFEHMPDPADVLNHIHRLLAPEGTCLLRIPTVNSFAWQHYGINWVQLDAPRHLFLHSIKSIQLLARQSGFYVDDIVYDSFDMQFWGSEQLAKDIPLTSERSWIVNQENSIFSGNQIAEFQSRARQLNRENQGDQACFYLRKE